jgi:hypothetical protein
MDKNLFGCKFVAIKVEYYSENEVCYPKWLYFSNPYCASP